MFFKFDENVTGITIFTEKSQEKSFAQLSTLVSMRFESFQMSKKEYMIKEEDCCESHLKYVYKNECEIQSDVKYQSCERRATIVLLIDIVRLLKFKSAILIIIINNIFK